MQLWKQQKKHWVRRKGEKKNEQWFDEDCRTAIHEKNNMRKIVTENDKK